jgi:hypothetical protein
VRWQPNAWGGSKFFSEKSQLYILWSTIHTLVNYTQLYILEIREFIIFSP